MTPRDHLRWLLDDMTDRRRRRAWLAACSAVVDTGEAETAALRNAIALKARHYEPGVAIIDDFRGCKFAVPQLLIFGDMMVGVWAYGEDVMSYRTIQLKPAHRALDAIAIVTSGHADWETHVKPLDFPYIVDVEASWNESVPCFRVRPAQYWSASRRPEYTLDDGNTTVADVLAFLRRDECAALATAPTDLEKARHTVRTTILGRNPAPQRMVERRIRAALRPWLTQRASQPGSLIDELVLDGAIADEAVAGPDGLHIFEIKGESDTFKRLKEQGRIYERVATTVTLVVARRHRSRALSAEVPDWWGILVVDGDPAAPTIYEERKPQINDTGRDVRSMLHTLRSVDLASIARAYGLRRPERICKEQVVQILAGRLSTDTVAFELGRALAHRYRGLRNTEHLLPDSAWPDRAGDALCLFADDPDKTRRMQRDNRLQQRLWSLSFQASKPEAGLT